jgi:hypothetical protein
MQDTAENTDFFPFSAVACEPLCIAAVGDEGLMTDGVRCDEGETSGKAHERGEAESEAVSPELATTDLQLAALVTTWPTLPPAIKAGIVALIRVAANG